MKSNQTSMTWHMNLLLPGLIAIFSLMLASYWANTLDQSEFIGLIGALCVLAIIIGVHSLLQRVGFNQWLPAYDAQGKQAMFSTLGNHMLVGNFLAIVAPLFLIFKRFQWGFLLTSLVVILTFNRAGLLALPLSLGVIWFCHAKGWRRPVIVIGSSLFLCVGLFIAKDYDGGRFAMWSDVWRYYTENGRSITGYGLGSLDALFRTGQGLVAHSSKFHHPHSEYLAILFEAGIIGAGLAGWAVLSTIIRFARSSKSHLSICLFASFCNVLVISFFSFPLHVAPIGLAALIVWVSLTITTHNYGVRYVSA